MNEERVNKVGSEACHQEETKQKKPWHAPVLEVVGLRETEYNPGSSNWDGGGFLS